MTHSQLGHLPGPRAYPSEDLLCYHSNAYKSLSVARFQYVTHHFLAEAVPALLGDVDGRLAVVVLDAGVGAGAEEEPHALALVLDDAVVERRVALARLLVQVGRVLHQEVDDVQRVAIVLPGDGVVQTSFRELL